MRAHLLLVLASGLPVGVSLVLTPFITSSLSTLEYGSYVNYLTLSAVVNVFLGLSSAGYVSNAYIHPGSASQVTSSMGGFLLMTVVPAACVAALAAHVSELPGATVTAALLLAGSFSYVTSAFQSFVILRRQYGLLLVLALAQVGAQTAVVLGLIMASKLSFWGLVLGHLAGCALSFLCVVLLWKRLGLSLERPERETLKKILVYGIPLVPHMFLSLAAGSFDRWFLVGAGRIDDLAVYAVALSISGAVLILLDMGNKVYSPTVFEQLKADDRDLGRFASRIAGFIASSLLVAGLVALAGYWFVILAFDPKYADAAWLCVYLSLASSGFSLYYAAAPFLYYFNKTSLVFFSSSAGALVTAVLSLLLFEHLHLHGLVIGKFAGFVVTGLVALAFAASVLKVNTVMQERTA